MEVRKEVLKKVLSLYKPEQRVLSKANVGYPMASGEFRVGSSFYSLVDMDHVTDIEIQLCLNQLSYVDVYTLIKQGIPESFSGIDFETLQADKMLIVESKKRFRRKIPTTQDIYGELEIKKLRKRNGVLFVGTEFQFEDRSCFGSLELAIIDK